MADVLGRSYIRFPEQTQLVTVDIEELDEVTRIGELCADHWRAVLSPSRPSVYWLAALPAMARFAQEFLRQADKYIEAACDLPDVPRDVSHEDARRQLSLFSVRAEEAVPQEPVAFIALTDAADELAELFKGIDVTSLSGLDTFCHLAERRLRRLAVEGDTPESTEDRAQELLSAAEELGVRLKQKGLFRERVVARRMHVHVRQQLGAFWQALDVEVEEIPMPHDWTSKADMALKAYHSRQGEKR